MSRDPVHEENGQWYFYDETWSDRLGPYESEKKARRKLKEYINWLDSKEWKEVNNS